MIREFLAAYIKSIKRICAVGAVFEEVFFALGKFFAAFVLCCDAYRHEAQGEECNYFIHIVEILFSDVY